MLRSAIVTAAAVLAVLSGFIGYRVGSAGEPSGRVVDRPPMISWTTPGLERLMDEHSCSRDWTNWPADRSPLGALVGDDAGVEHATFSEGWDALVDLDDGRNLVAVCAN